LNSIIKYIVLINILNKSIWIRKISMVSELVFFEVVFIFFLMNTVFYTKYLNTLKMVINYECIMHRAMNSWFIENIKN